MTITVNGKPEEVSEGTTILQYLQMKGAAIERTVVERNTNIVKKRDFGATVLSHGDSLEVLSFVGGG